MKEEKVGLLEIPQGWNSEIDALCSKHLQIKKQLDYFYSCQAVGDYKSLKALKGQIEHLGMQRRIILRRIQILLSGGVFTMAKVETRLLGDEKC